MSGLAAPETSVIDDLDRRIIHALQIDPRASFSRVGEVIGVSEQTVARRYRRLRADGLLRVIGLVDPRHYDQSEWMIRVGCRPGGGKPLAEALARRDDVSWVTLTAGGSEIVCSVRSRSAEQRDDLLLQRLPATNQVISMTAHAILHRYVGGMSNDWLGYGEGMTLLTQAQVAVLRAAAGTGPDPANPADPANLAGPADQGGPDRDRVQPEDGPLLDELIRDGRSSYAALAAASGWSQGRVARRVEALRRARILYFDVELATEVLGFTALAYLWLTVEPARLAAAGEQIARHDEVPFAAAVTGSANLAASVVCRDTEALYQYVTTRISAIDGVRQLEVSPQLRRLKAAGTEIENRRLALSPPVRTQSRSRIAAPGRSTPSLSKETVTGGS